MTLAVKESGLSLQAIADQAGTSKGQVSQWQTEGAVNPDNVKADVLEKNCAALGVRPRWLLYDEQPMRPAVQSQSPSLRPDPVMLAESIAACRSLARRNGWDYDPGVHADVTADTYVLRTLLPAIASQTDVIDFGQKVAERLAREFGNGEGGPGAGAAVGGNDRGGHATGAGARKAGTAGRSR